MAAYYNEIDPKAAAWLRELIRRGHIVDGIVDERSIEDVEPADLVGFSQCHFFAGIGVWSYALRCAGWPGDRPVWTGSCPCQPFSAAGKGGGFVDERHLWPSWYWLIKQCRPAVVLGEQVASKDAEPWLDLVQADLEAVGYAVGAVPFPSAGVGAPHIRDRLYWVAEGGDRKDADAVRREEATRHSGSRRTAGRLAAADGGDASAERQQRGREHGLESQDGGAGRVGHTDGDGAGWDRGCLCGEVAGEDGQPEPHDVGASGGSRRLADAEHPERRKERFHRQDGRNRQDLGRQEAHGLVGARGQVLDTGPTNGIWRDADWLFCRDGKWRPVEASPQPMADGTAESLGRVCDARVHQVAEEVNAFAMEVQIKPTSALRALRAALGAQTRSKWEAGRLPGLHEAPFLLAFLRQLAAQGWAVEEDIPLSCSEDARRRVRVLWGDVATSGTPHQRGLDGQLAGERSDALHLLSSLLARHAQEAWGEAYDAYAETGFPLGRNSRNRVMRLRGYGNAIVAPAAQAFIEAYLEATDLRRNAELIEDMLS